MKNRFEYHGDYCRYDPRDKASFAKALNEILPSLISTIARNGVPESSEIIIWEPEPDFPMGPREQERPSVGWKLRYLDTKLIEGEKADWRG